VNGLADYLELLKYGAIFAIADGVLLLVLIAMVGVVLARLPARTRTMPPYAHGPAWTFTGRPPGPPGQR